MTGEAPDSREVECPGPYACLNGCDQHPPAPPYRFDVIEDPRVPEGTFYLRPTPPPCPACGHPGDLSSVPSGDHVVILESPADWSAAVRTTIEDLRANTFGVTVTSRIRFAWCSTIDRSHL